MARRSAFTRRSAPSRRSSPPAALFVSGAGLAGGRGAGACGPPRRHLRPLARFRDGAPAAAPAIELQQQVGGRRHRFAALDRLDHCRQSVVRGEQQPLEARLGAGEHDLLGGVAELGERRDRHHAAGALQGVQLALDLDQGSRPAGELRHEIRESLQALARLGDEDRHELEKLVVHGSSPRSSARD